MLRWVWFKMTLLSKWRHYFANKSPYSPSYSFFSSHTWIWELDHKESWAPKNWCFWTVVLEKTLGSPLDCKELEPVHPKGDQSWIFIGRTDAETETPVLWSPDVKSRVTGKDGAAGETGGRRRKWWQDKMAGWQHGLSGHGFEQVLETVRTGKPGVLQSTGSQRVGHVWATEQQLLRGFPEGEGWVKGLQCRRCGFDPWVGKTPWRRNWHHTPVFLPGKSQKQRSLAGYSPRGCKEADTTEPLIAQALSEKAGQLGLFTGSRPRAKTNSETNTLVVLLFYLSWELLISIVNGKKHIWSAIIIGTCIFQSYVELRHVKKLTPKQL